MKQRKIFCEYNSFFYWLSCQKENFKRTLYNKTSHTSLASIQQVQSLPVIVKGHRSLLLRQLDGVNQELQKNKVTNLQLAIEKMNGIVIKPGEVFSFWHCIGKPTKKKGYLNGLVLSNGKPGESVGGGLCQLANMIHWLVLHSPLEVVELHHHTDSLFPDSNRRIPFGTGTSIFYKNVDYRFKNNTKQDVQLVFWLDHQDLCAELRTTQQFPNKYKIIEEDSHFTREVDGYYRISSIYKIETNRADKTLSSKDLVLQNHSKVLYDFNLIPTEEIR